MQTDAGLRHCLAASGAIGWGLPVFPMSLRSLVSRVVLTVVLFVTVVRAADLQRAVVVVPNGLSPRGRVAIDMLVDEVEKRSRLRWPVVTEWPKDGTAVVAVGPVAALDALAGIHAAGLKAGKFAEGPEGYRLAVRTGQGGPATFVLGNDDRGILFGVGRLIRELRLEPGKASIDDALDVATAPKYPLRGHQLGYRPKCNSYDAWDLPVWEQYIRDLAIFGCNAIELIPPRSDDDADSPHFPRPPLEMMIGMSAIADKYGLDVWIWYPAMDSDYADPKTVEFALREWGDVFRKLPRVDVVFVPGGDPGHTAPATLMALLARQSDNLRKHHPKARIWVSPQSFDNQWLGDFLSGLGRDQPDWLGGVVFGPQVRIDIADLRARVPARYPIRNYPDITHSRQCQYPVADWDVAFALTEGRECINPRPMAEATIFRGTQPGTIGFLSYSEGCNDDVNKFVWSGLGWDPDAPVRGILREYARAFVGDRFAVDFAEGLMALERNWSGSLLANAGVETTLAQFQSMERAVPPGTLRNWRFQQALFRAHYDAYTRRRLIYETDLEARANERLGRAEAGETLLALADAERILDRALTERPAPELRARILSLGEALFQSISMQLDTARYKAIAPDRGASLDTLDYPLNNRTWLKERFAKIRAMKSEPERLTAIRAVVGWTNPGPGGFYDDPGNPALQPHVVRGAGFDADPGSFRSARANFEEDLVVDEPDEKPDGARRIAWCDHMESMYDAPFTMRYEGLEAGRKYRLRVVYGGDNPKRRMRLVANGGIEIHPYITRPFPYAPIEFDIPEAATRGGTLKLDWTGEQGLGGNGRFCQVSEVWLLKVPAEK